MALLNQGGMGPPGGVPCVGDIVYVFGYDFATIVGIGCCIHRRGRGGGRFHIQYADGKSYHVQIRNLRLLPQGLGISYTLELSDCRLCGETGFVIGSSCGHSACRRCWSRWANAQLHLCAGHRFLPCWGERCDLGLSNRFIKLLDELFSGSQPWHASCPDIDGMRTWIRRRRLQVNPLFPPEVQVDCYQPGCMGLGYLGSETVMCFFCEEQWTPCDIVPTDTQHENSISGTKLCPQCCRVILKDGGCDHMTCPCGHEFWWSTLRPYP